MGIDVVFVDAGADGDEARTIAAFDAAITADTRLVSISHVLWTTGAVMPVARIAEIAHARGALVVVDGAQAAGAIPVRFDALGADLYAIPAQKWLLGPEGMGALVVDPARVGDLVPATGGSLDFERLDLTGEATWWRDARRFDRSGFHRPSIVGMARSIGWLSMYVGLDFVHRRGTAAGDRGRDAPRRHPRRDRADPETCDGDPGDLPDRRLVGNGRARRARVAGLRDRPNDRRSRRAADQRRLLQLGG